MEMVEVRPAMRVLVANGHGRVGERRERDNRKREKKNWEGWLVFCQLSTRFFLCSGHEIHPYL
jgi:hypothetical protein